MIRFLCLMIFIGLLTGCFGGGQVVPQNRYYHLADVSAALAKIVRPFGVVAVSSMQSDVLHRGRMILYSQQSMPLTVKTYYYRQWADAPGNLIQEYLINYLHQAGFARRVIRYGESTHVDAQIGGYIQRFERIVGGSAPKVSVRLELRFKSRQPGRHLTFSKVYHVELAADSDSMEATVAAFSQALQTICGRFVKDMVQQQVSGKSNGS